MDAAPHFQTLQDSLKSALLATTRTTTELCAEDLAFHRSLDPAIATTLDSHNARLLSLAERLLCSGAQGADVVGPKLQDSDALDTNWRGVVDVVDSLLERVDTTLDGLRGIVKRGVDNAPDVCHPSTRRGCLQSRLICICVGSEGHRWEGLSQGHEPSQAAKEFRCCAHER